MIDALPKIKRLLSEKWDPIGVNGLGPDDEYDSYAFRVFVMLKEGRRESAIAEYLKWVETENMGLDESGLHESIAASLVDIYEAGETAGR